MINSNTNTKKTFILSSISVGLAVLYIWAVIALDVFELFKPESLGDVLVSYAYLSIPLLIPASIVTSVIFYPIVNSKKTPGDKLASVVVALPFLFTVWVVYAFVFFLTVAAFVEVLH